MEKDKNTDSRFLSCDWGTSSFRLKWIEGETGRVLASTESTQGIKLTFEEWLDSGRPSRIEFYQSILKRAIDELEEKYGEPIRDCPVILSGMASASIGMQELPYASLPLPLDGSGLIAEEIPATRPFPHTTLLISGARKPGDVMRGEEVQAVGWHQFCAFPWSACTFILPGTHSKHLYIDQNRIVDFKTYMTGELYHLLLTHSILKNSIKPTKVWNGAAQSAFAQGVEATRQGELTNQLFSIRARGLEKTLDDIDAGYYLSGLLIGHEFGAMPDRPIVLGGSTRFHALYSLAMEVLGLKDRLTALPPEQEEQLVFYGHQTAWTAAIRLNRS